MLGLDHILTSGAVYPALFAREDGASIQLGVLQYAGPPDRTQYRNACSCRWHSS